MSNQIELASTIPHIAVPIEGLLLPRMAPDDIEMKFADEVDLSLTECAPGYFWDVKKKICALDITPRSAKCPWGYSKNIRLDECRRGKYNLEAERGTIRRWYDKMRNAEQDAAKAKAKASTPVPGSAADLITHIPTRRPQERVLVKDGTDMAIILEGITLTGKRIPQWK